MFIISIMKTILILIISLQISLWATAPSIQLFSPKTDFSSQKNTVLFKGTIKNATTLTINGHPIPLHNNRFYIKADLNPHQKNPYTLIAKNKDHTQIEIKRTITYFPKKTKKRAPNFQIADITFNPLSNLWQINGIAKNSNSLSINGTPIPINEEKQFNYWFHPNTEKPTTLYITGIGHSLHLFSKQIGLYETESLPESKRHMLSTNANYKTYEAAIIKSFFEKNWRQVPLSPIQAKMLNELINNNDEGLSTKHINVMKQDKNLVVIIPLLYKSLSIDAISYQLALILQNTDPNHEQITLLWYNTTPSFLEIVYVTPIHKTLSQYWILDDLVSTADQLRDSKALSIYKKQSFL